MHFHFIQQLVEDGEVELKYFPTQNQSTNIFTKSLSLDKFVKFKNKLGVVSRMAIKRGC
jgi:hypothetical protein